MGIVGTYKMYQLTESKHSYWFLIVCLLSLKALSVNNDVGYVENEKVEQNNNTNDLNEK